MNYELVQEPVFISSDQSTMPCASPIDMECLISNALLSTIYVLFRIIPDIYQLIV